MWLSNIEWVSQFASGRQSPKKNSGKSSPKKRRGSELLDGMEGCWNTRKRARTVSTQSNETSSLDPHSVKERAGNDQSLTIDNLPFWWSEEQRRIGTLRILGLQKERHESKVTEWWEKQLAWARETPQGSRRWFWTMGQETTFKGEPYELSSDFREALSGDTFVDE